MHHHKHNTFVAIEAGTGDVTFQEAIDLLVHLVQLVLGRSSMQTFTHNVGETHRYQLAVLKQDGTTPGTTATPVVYSVDNPAIATVTPNTAVALNLQFDIAYLAPGTATVTATGTNEAGNPFSTQFQFVVTPVPPDLSASFVATEIS
jgi:hypothetical protein